MEKIKLLCGGKKLGFNKFQHQVFCFYAENKDIVCALKHHKYLLGSWCFKAGDILTVEENLNGSLKDNGKLYQVIKLESE